MYWTGKNVGGGSTLTCRMTRISRSGPPGRARPPRPAPARASVSPDVYDPERIKAALRGGHARKEHGGRRTSDPGVLAPAPGGVGLDSSDPGMSVDSGTSGDGWSAPATGPGWDPAPDTGVTGANGNHSAALGNRGPFDAAFTSLTETAEPASTEEFSWLEKGEPESRPAGGDLTWSEQTGNGGSAELADSSYGWSGRTQTARPAETLPSETLPAEQDDADVTWPNAGLASRMAAGSRHADPELTERILRHQAEGLAAREPTDFWGQSLPQAPADLRTPAATPRAEEPAVTEASWTAAEPAHRTAAVPTRPVSAQPVNTGTSQTQAAAHERDRRQDRYFPARLLAVIVIAALIGSALVLLLK